MMQVDPRRTSRTTKNFIAKNKSGCANHTHRKETISKSHEKAHEETEKRKPKRLLPAASLSTSATGSETVTIPREYLQHLLKKEHVDDFNSLAQLPSPHLFHMDYITAESHENGRAQEDYPQQAACSSEEDEYTMSLHPAAKGTLRTAHGQWLDDIAAQIKEEERLMRKNERVEDYFLFDKLGSSLPLDYQERARNEGHRRQRMCHSPSPPSHHCRHSLPHGYKIPSSLHHQYHSHRRYERSPSPSPPPGTYHRGTSNRPVHPAMRSSIPFGPGGGSGGGEKRVEKTIARHRTRKADEKDCRPNHGHTSGSHHQHKVSGPHYGRGAGPHVNEYVLQEKNDRMRKEEQHKEYLQQQILEKQRQKEAEKLREQKQELEDEMRIEREREQMEREFRREQEKTKEKMNAVAMHQKFIEDDEMKAAVETGIRTKKTTVPQNTKLRRGSKNSLHSTSSEETAVVVQYRGRKARLPVKKKIRQSLPGRMSAVRRLKSNQSDSETDQHKQPGRGKTIFASANSVARAGSMKPGVIQQPVANSHVRAKIDVPQQPDPVQTTPPPPPLSPPVPALAKKLAEQQRQQHSRRQLSLPSISEQAQSTNTTSVDNQQANGNLTKTAELSNPYPLPVIGCNLSSGSPPCFADGHRSHSLPARSATVELPPLPPTSHTIPQIEIRHAATRKMTKLSPINKNHVNSFVSVGESHQELVERPLSSSPLNQPMMDDDTDVLNICLPTLIEVNSSQQMKAVVRSSEPNLQLATSDLEQKVQSHEQKLKEQEELIKLLQAQLSSQQPRDQCQQQQQPKNLIKEHSTTAKQTETQHQVLKQLASLKMGILRSRI